MLLEREPSSLTVAELTFCSLFDFAEELLRVAPYLHGRLGPDVVLNFLPRPAIFLYRCDKKTMFLVSPALALFG